MKKLCFILLILLTSCHEDQPKDKEVSKACINQHCFNLILAKTDAERTKGLRGKPVLQTNEGMLFVFKDEAIRPFWMPDMNFPIDIIWINQHQEIVYIAKDAKPCPRPSTQENCHNITPNKIASSVLEVKAGLANDYQMKIGDKVTFN